MSETTSLYGSREVLSQLARVHEVSALGTQSTLDGEDAGLRTRDVYVGTNVEENETVVVGPFSLSVKRVRHVVPTFAVKVSTPDGSSFAYSADTVADSETIKWLSDSSLFAHDSCGGPIHASPEDLERLVDANDRRRCMLLHRDDRDYSYAEKMGFLVPDAGYSVLL
jgi:ribonuclease BN (tRNA processing enzyme)